MASLQRIRKRPCFEGIKQLLDHPEQLSHYKEKVIKRGKEFTLEVLMKPIETLLTR